MMSCENWHSFGETVTSHNGALFSVPKRVCFVFFCQWSVGRLFCGKASTECDSLGSAGYVERLVNVEITASVCKPALLSTCCLLV